MIVPRENEALIGHEKVEQRCLQDWQRGTLPHSLLIAGPKGIGKATFAYRLARFILSGGEGDNALFGPENLFVPEESPIFKRVATGSHGDLLTIMPDSEAATPIIKVDAVRKVGGFLSLTPAESAWRVVIVDSADDLNNNAANALLKVLEEPPSHSIIMLISHNPGKLLPTIRSRCRKLAMGALSRPDFEKVLESAGLQASAEEIEMLHMLSLGAPGLALQLREAHGEQLYKLLLDCLDNAPTLNQGAVSELVKKAGDSKKVGQWLSWKHMWDMMLHRILLIQNDISIPSCSEEERRTLSRLAQSFDSQHWLQVMECSHQWFLDADTLHLDRKQVIHSLLNAACGVQAI